MWVERDGLLLLFLDDGQVDIVVFGLTPNTEAPGLDIGKDDADEFSKGSRIQNRYSLRSTLFCITAIHPVSSYRAIALSAVLS